MTCISRDVTPAAAVVQALADGKVITTISMDGCAATRSSIAVSDGHLFVRNEREAVVHWEVTWTGG